MGVTRECMFNDEDVLQSFKAISSRGCRHRG